MADEFLELPCIKCGNAAAQVNLRPAIDLVPNKYKIAARGAQRLGAIVGVQKVFDWDAPAFGLDPIDISRIIGVVCIPCVDAAANEANAPWPRESPQPAVAP